MTGIDTVAAALLASRIDSLLSDVVAPPAGGGAAPQVGTPAAGASPSAAPAAPAASAPQASVQTALSEVGLALDAISRFGGDATPAVVGRLPLLADPSILLTDPEQPAGMRPAAAQDAPRTAALQSDQPMFATTLRTALAQAVGESGLFYESHLAQWLAGQRPLAALLREPQARLPLAASAGAAEATGATETTETTETTEATDDALDALLDPRLPLPSAAARPAAPASTASAAGVPPRAAARGLLSADALPARLSGAADPLQDTADSALTPGWTPARAALAGAAPDPQAAAQASVHPAAVPLVRQQLDVLATDQFRWIGEAWPGARLDWTIEPDRSGGQAARGGNSGDSGDAGDGSAWRTRLTLTLPSLGTVDAELVLNGEQLVARLRANHAGAERLTRHEAAFRQRLEASGLQLGGLSIRAVDGTPDGFDALAAQAAASAYARSARGAEAGMPRDAEPGDGAPH
ncbi:flagellar hook-length control protein FliK [Burkholderia sp. Bp8963]|uniref:flagellar hook-length control protein FliK n=1 Tax=Burkholderia sp. Bp8963 TaxID=2184547 RepID=UPI000F58F805|nr:flagellar hook-length control protein FliK [Burkholderia sp. Bp8963]RQS68999.1 flagellar hook-length control protein FliK [Burkholderia sp. Bp8963]